MKRKLSMRAECMIDMFRFCHLMCYSDQSVWVGDPAIKYTIWGTTLTIDVDNDDLTIDYFKNIASNVVDGHCMLETMAWGDDYQDRDYSSSDFRKSDKYIKLTCPCDLTLNG